MVVVKKRHWLFYSASLLIIGTFTLLTGTVFAHDSSESTRSVSHLPREQASKMSNQIDALVQAKLAEHGQSRNRPASDEIFLRRAYLDIIGRIPTLEEAKRFLNSKDRNKRQKLIDQLLDSYGYVSRQYNFIADLLRIKSKVRNQLTGQPYIDYVKDSLYENKPYDEFVRELLVAQGSNMERGNGAVGYYLRDYNMPEDNMSNTVRVFLGTRLECAQCHDHPFDKWTQRQYFEMVAFTGGMNFRLNTPYSENAEDIKNLRRDPSINQQTKAVLRRLVDPMTFGVVGTGTGLARLPEGFMGDDGDEFDIVTAKTMFEGDELVAPKPMSKSNKASRARNRNPQQIKGARNIGSRDAYANWMTDSTNPRFAKVFVNRLWKQAMGLGLVEPVDVFEDGTVASNPELLDYLTQAFIDLNYDMKQMLRIIYNTKTYQAKAYPKDVLKSAEYYFNGPIVRRMSAEQIWDSLLTMTVPDTDQRQSARSNNRLDRYVGGDDIYETYDKLHEMTADELVDLAKSVSSGGKSMQNMMASDRRKKTQANARMQQARKKLTNEIRAARKQGNSAKVRRLMNQLNSMAEETRKQSGGSGMYRASEISSPAPAGHFLREFGQSDRETIENANSEPSVTQALSLMNGYIETRIAKNSTTVLMQNIYEAAPKDRVDAVYLTMLGRKPTKVEEAGWVKDSKNQTAAQVISDLIWTLANSNEFIFIK
ncbi:MAG: DUF1549 and DUF1553 domain-containing protein [Mariniblastus sp.]|nr:DUF1549 and DUF1553 domain-containing protein [Mariniblastus sp.]